MDNNSRSKDVVIDEGNPSVAARAKSFRDALNKSRHIFRPSPDFYSSRNTQGIKREYTSEIRYDEGR